MAVGHRQHFLRLLIILFGCLILGAGTVILVAAATDNSSQAAILGHDVFVIGISIWVWRSENLSLSSAGTVLGAVGVFIAIGILLASLGGSLYFSAPWLGRLLVNAFAIGYYPPGADVPFDMGALLWAFSMLGLCAAGLAFGGLLRMVPNREHLQVDGE